MSQLKRALRAPRNKVYATSDRRPRSLSDPTLDEGGAAAATSTQQARPFPLGRRRRTRSDGALLSIKTKPPSSPISRFILRVGSVGRRFSGLMSPSRHLKKTKKKMKPSPKKPVSALSPASGRPRRRFFKPPTRRWIMTVWAIP